MQNKHAYLLLSFCVLLLYAGCGHEEITAPPPVDSVSTTFLSTNAIDAEQAAEEITAAFGWEIAADAENVASPRSASPLVSNFQRTAVVGNIVHYSMDVAVGPGPYDVIRLHRVFDESRPIGQLRKGGNIFLLHGDGLGFVKFMFGAVTPELPDEQSAAVFLAQGGVDVWGMDQSWVLVPDLPDYGFAAGWGLQNQVDNLDAGLAVARATRLRTGFGPGKMNLLGYSSGGLTGYAYLNEQTELPLWERHVSGFVAADMFYKYGPELEPSHVASCEFEQFYQDMLDNGEYDLGFGFLAVIGELADSAPDDPSPFFPGFTNLQTALVLVSVPDGTNFGTPWYHFAAGIFENDLPVDLRFSRTAAFLDFLQLFVPFEPTLFARDYCSVWCDEEDVPWDDHLSEIDVPVLSLGTGGGLGGAAGHTLDLLGSTDKTFIVVNPIGNNVLDFGHVDLWTADNAPQDAWTPLLSWIRSHQDQPGRHSIRPHAGTP